MKNVDLIHLLSTREVFQHVHFLAVRPSHLLPGSKPEVRCQFGLNMIVLVLEDGLEFVNPAIEWVGGKEPEGSRDLYIGKSFRAISNPNGQVNAEALFEFSIHTTGGRVDPTVINEPYIPPP